MEAAIFCLIVLAPSRLRWRALSEGPGVGLSAWPFQEYDVRSLDMSAG
jgi:hypothetical protein